MSEPTILVPGFKDTTRNLFLMTHWLAKANLHPHPFAPQPSNGTVRLEGLAHQLARYIAEHFPANEPINLFGFSMGGLVCRYYVQELGGWRRTQRLVTLGTPHQGTYTAYMFDRPACVQMRPGSPFLADLNRDLTPLQRISFSSIWTPLDLTIFPAANSTLPVGEMITVVSPFHGVLPYDPRIVRTVVTQLRKPITHQQ